MNSHGLAAFLGLVEATSMNEHRVTGKRKSSDVVKRLTMNHTLATSFKTHKNIVSPASISANTSFRFPYPSCSAYSSSPFQVADLVVWNPAFPDIQWGTSWSTRPANKKHAQSATLQHQSYQPRKNPTFFVRSRNNDKTAVRTVHFGHGGPAGDHIVGKAPREVGSVLVEWMDAR